jgi:hypothetical protein
VTAFVRGDANWSVLAELGVQIELEDSGVRLHEPAGLPAVVPGIADVAAGFVRSLELGGQEQREWARVLLAANFIDLFALENDPNGDALLEAIWSASQGDEVDEGDVALAKELAK